MAELIVIAVVFVLNNIFVNQLNGTAWHKIWPADPVWWAFHLGVLTGQFLISWCIAETGLFLCFDWRYETPIVLILMVLQAAGWPILGWLIEVWPEKKFGTVVPAVPAVEDTLKDLSLDDLCLLHSYLNGVVEKAIYREKNPIVAKATEVIRRRIEVEITTKQRANK